MSRELLSSCGIDIDGIAKATYSHIRQKFGVDYSDSEIARLGYCVDTATQITHRLRRSERLGALGLRAATLIAEIDGQYVTHYYTALRENRADDPMDDILVDGAYGQFVSAPKDKVFVGSRAQMIDFMTNECRNPDYGQLYTEAAILEHDIPDGLFVF